MANMKIVQVSLATSMHAYNTRDVLIDVISLQAIHIISATGITVDRENFAVKIISQSRPTVKIKHAKNKIIRR